MVIIVHSRIPLPDHLLVHLLGTIKRSIAVFNDILVPEMGISCEEGLHLGHHILKVV
jgi:hypothetical protein